MGVCLCTWCHKCMHRHKGRKKVRKTMEEEIGNKDSRYVREERCAPDLQSSVRWEVRATECTVKVCPPFLTSSSASEPRFHIASTPAYPLMRFNVRKPAPPILWLSLFILSLSDGSWACYAAMGTCRRQ